MIVNVPVTVAPEVLAATLVVPFESSSELGSVFNWVWVAVTAPVMLGHVALMVVLIKRKWSSACARASVDVGLVVTNPLIYVELSKARGISFSHLKGRTTIAKRTRL